MSNVLASIALPLEPVRLKSPTQQKSAFKLTQIERIPSSPTKQLEFIPYVQERDHMGHLIGRERRPSITSPKVNLTPMKFKSLEHVPSVLATESAADSSVNFETFKYQPKISICTAKKQVHSATKPGSPISSPISPTSPCFMARGRLEDPPKQMPSVGYYEPDGKLVFRSTTEVVFPKERKMKPPGLLEDSIENVDMIKTFTKVHDGNVISPDILRQTTRDNHFMNKFTTHLDAKPNKGRRGYDYHSVGVKFQSGGKETNDVQRRLKDTHQFSQNTLPMTTGGLHDKFSQIKKKYNIFSIKLK